MNTRVELLNHKLPDHTSILKIRNTTAVNWCTWNTFMLEDHVHQAVIRYILRHKHVFWLYYNIISIIKKVYTFLPQDYVFCLLFKNIYRLLIKSVRVGFTFLLFKATTNDVYPGVNIAFYPGMTHTNFLYILGSLFIIFFWMLIVTNANLIKERWKTISTVNNSIKRILHNIIYPGV